MKHTTLTLPQELEDGLLLRWGTPADADELAAFNVRVHSDDPDEPEAFLAHWTRDLMRGDHPTTGASDFTLVVDTKNDNKIVSSLNLISQQWQYGDVAFGVGRPELVGTDPDYRRRGLVRRQMAVVHALSASRGEMVQAITGIPWYYRLFDYEMALNLGGSRIFFWERPGNEKTVEEEAYRIREATPGDIPILAQLYQRFCAESLIRRLRDETQWRYEMSATHPDSPYRRDFQLIEPVAGGEPVAYVEYRHWGNRIIIRELGVAAGHSWRAVALFLTRYLKAEAERLNPERKKKLKFIIFDLGETHPAYRALGRQLERPRPPYAWYIRVPDLPGFIRHIRPALEERLAESVVAGHTGEVKLNFYRRQMTLTFEAGRLAEVGTYTPKRVEDGDALFPDLTFLQLLFGYRSLGELTAAYADCNTQNAETAVLLKALFPKQPSHVVGLG